MAGHRVLFISAPIGSGHIRAAEAVKLAMQEQRPEIETNIANVFDFFSPFLGHAILRIYLKILAVFPQAYGLMYGWGNNNAKALALCELVNSHLAERMHKYILAYQPSVIVCTHATPAGLVAYLREKNRLNIPAVAIVTDFIVHRLWVHPELDYYFVANEEMRDFLAKYGVDYTHSKATGIPVDCTFTLQPDKKKIYETLGLSPDRKTLLIMGGGAGVLPLDELVAACDRLDVPLQMLVVAGNNMGMYKKLQTLQPLLRSPSQIFGYVNNIHELMAVADVLISKPGGMTSAEALCSGLPMIIYRPIPGQEEANTHYLVGRRVALRADSLSDLQLILRNLLVVHPEQLTFLRQNALSLGRSTTAQDIASCIFSHFSS